MAFSQASIEGLTVSTGDSELRLSWSTTAVDGTWFQVYVDRRLTWQGTSRHCQFPIPAGAQGRNVWIDVGAVDADEALVDFSANLGSAAMGTGYVRLSWSGATYLDPTGNGDVSGFRIYRGLLPGAIDWSTAVDTVPAYPGGWVSDGFGLGGFGLGGFGQAETLYEWSQVGHPGGAWEYAIVAYDGAGNNRGTGQSVALTVRSAPRPPAAQPDGTRLAYQYSGPSARQATLSWLASPSSPTQ